MDYKEKYEQGLECIQEILCGAGDSIKTSILRKRLQPFFPELKESEDGKNKRISKEITQFLKQNNGWNREWLAWLEKQGEQTHVELGKSEVTVTPTCDNNKAFSQNSKNEYLGGTYMHGYRQAIDDVCEWIGQQHEMLEDCFSDVNDFADLVRETILKKGVGYE